MIRMLIPRDLVARAHVAFAVAYGACALALFGAGAPDWQWAGLMGLTLSFSATGWWIERQARLGWLAEDVELDDIEALDHELRRGRRHG